MKHNLLIATAISVATLAACKKDKGDPVDPPVVLTENEKSLAGTTWRIVMTQTTITTTAGDVMQTQEQPTGCEADNSYTYNADKTISLNEGANVCAGMNPKNEWANKWSFANSDNKILIYRNGNQLPDTFYIQDIHNRDMILEWTSRTSSAKTTYVYSYAKVE